MAEKKASNAASPPADAPMPTMGKPGTTSASASCFGHGAGFHANGWFSEVAGAAVVD